MQGKGNLQRQQPQLGVTEQEVCASDKVKDVNVWRFARLRYLVIAQTKGHPPKEKRLLPSPTLMATVSVFWISACFSILRTTIDSRVPGSITALETRLLTLMVIQNTQSFSPERLPYPSSENFTPSPAACRHLEFQLSFLFLALSPFLTPTVLGLQGGAARF